MYRRAAPRHRTAHDGGRRRRGTAAVLAIVALGGCTTDGEDRAEDAVVTVADDILHYADSRLTLTDLGPHAVEYMGGLAQERGGQVLSRWSRPGNPAGEQVARLDVAFTRRSTNDAWGSGATVTRCVRFTAALSYEGSRELDWRFRPCPPEATPTPVG